MKIAILKERRPNEARVAGSPETVKKFISLGVDVVVEKGAGTAASMSDAEFREAGAAIAADGQSQQSRLSHAMGGASLRRERQRCLRRRDYRRREGGYQL